MANIYEFAVSRGIVEKLVADTGLSLESDVKENIVDVLMDCIDRPGKFTEVLMDFKPGLFIHVGQIVKEGYEGQGLHALNHSGSEDFLEMLEFNRRLINSLERQGVVYKNITKQFSFD